MVLVSDGTAIGATLAPERADVTSRHVDVQISATSAHTSVAERPRQHANEREAIELGRGVAIGVVIGVPIGSAVAAGVVMLAVPQSGLGGIELGVLVGAFWGIFFGGLGGVVPKVIAQTRAGH